MAKIIDGELLRNMIMEGACAIEQKKLAANELNVFPVPDGDTGTNMSLTMNAAYREMEKLSNPTVSKVADTAAGALLRGARGNSGVILSLLFRGMAKALKDQVTCSGQDLAGALNEGVGAAYKAVMKPAEGTILTVSRVSAATALEVAGAGGGADEVLSATIETAKEALTLTTRQNPVLEKAGVVDAGGFGYIAILEGMYAILSGKERSILSEISDLSGGNVFASFETEDITFAYCTEFIAERQDKRRSVNKLRQFLQNIGDSAVVVDDDNIIKVHVHTNSPDKVLGEALKFGQLLTTKIDNMREQHTERVLSGNELSAKPKVALPERKFGFVAVAAGEGVASLFRDLGVDIVVSGGQTMNPSTEDILAAAEQTPAEVVFILPNNKNIIMAAEQAADLCLEKQIVVIPSRTIPQGITAMLAFNPEAGTRDNTGLMRDALKNVRTGQITYAVRDSSLDGKKIKSGDYIALLEARLHSHGQNAQSVMKKLARDLVPKDAAFITVLYGEGVTEEEAEAFRALLQNEAKDAEINVIDGGQPVYYYIISVE